MNTLKSLMEEFSILGMEPSLPPQLGDTVDPALRAGTDEGEDEFLTDENGNIIKDANGNPIKKPKPEGAQPEAGGACTCGGQDDNIADAGAATLPAMDTEQPAEFEDEFNFDI